MLLPLQKNHTIHYVSLANCFSGQHVPLACNMQEKEVKNGGQTCGVH